VLQRGVAGEVRQDAGNAGNAVSTANTAGSTANTTGITTGNSADTTNTTGNAASTANTAEQAPGLPDVPIVLGRINISGKDTHNTQTPTRDPPKSHTGPSIASLKNTPFPCMGPPLLHFTQKCYFGSR